MNNAEKGNDKEAGKVTLPELYDALSHTDWLEEIARDYSDICKRLIEAEDDEDKRKTIIDEAVSNNSNDKLRGALFAVNGAIRRLEDDEK